MSSTRMPALFLGHGSPMNVLEDNVYTVHGSNWGNVAATESHSRGFGALVYPWHWRNCHGSTENDS